jgi:D-alanyl-D-alanine carboxypeptidase/D-alanyl-D-alanine-endopeptidase (penicillin-binding protein 4)
MQLFARMATILWLISVGMGHSSAHAQNASTAPPSVPVVHVAYPAGTSTPLGQQIDALLANPAIARAHWGIAITTLDGTPLYGLDESKLFRPASNAKIFTTAAAMALLGPNATVSTQIYFPSIAVDGVIKGDLTLVGHGDANLSDRQIPYVGPLANAATQPPTDPLRAVDELAADVAKAGVRHITGDIIGSDWPWEPYPQGWGTDDLLWGYGAPVSGLAIDDNEILLTVTPGTLHNAAIVTLTPDVGYYQVESTVTTTGAGSPEGLTIHRDPSSRTLHLDGLLRAGRPYKTEIAVDDPPLYAAFALAVKLREHGITVDGVAKSPHEFAGNPDDFLGESRAPLQLPLQGIRGHLPGLSPPGPPDVVLNHTSPTLAEDVTVALKDSQNLHAEMMLRRLAFEFGGDLSSRSSTFAQGARVVRQYLINAGLDPDDFVFYDGSGLSTKDLVTPRATVQLLAFAAKQPWFPQWKAAFPIGGVDGTLESRFRQPSLKDHIFAKTGTMGESRALSGYLDAASGRTIIFSIFVDDHTPASSTDRATMDKIVAAIAAAE